MERYIAFLLFVLSPCAYSTSDWVQLSRYFEAKSVATNSQLNPLNSIVSVQFPVTVRTVKDAIDYVLDDTGYEVVHEQLWTDEMRLILESKIAHTQRDLKKSPLRIIDVIGVVAGEAFFVVRDPLRKKVSLILKENYRGLIDGK